MSEHKLWQKEFDDYLAVLDMGAKKYSPHGWLEPNGTRTSFKEYHDSMFHHLAKSFSGIRNDDESGLDHLLHLITNAQMMYTRLKRGIINTKDMSLDINAALKYEANLDVELNTIAKTISGLNGPNYKPIETRYDVEGYDDSE